MCEVRKYLRRPRRLAPLVALLGEREGTDAFASDGEDGVADSGKNGWTPRLAKSS